MSDTPEYFHRRIKQTFFNPLSANPTKWSNTQTILRLLPTNCLNVFDHFVGMTLKGLKTKLFNLYVCQCAIQKRFIRYSLKETHHIFLTMYYVRNNVYVALHTYRYTK